MARVARNAPDAAVDGRDEAAPGSRLRRADRRAALIDAAAELLATESPDGISMENVAARAGVSRPLVYKHFANRDELLAAVFRRDYATLDAEIAAAVEAAPSFEGKIRALITSVLEAEATRGEFLATLGPVGVRDAGFRSEQRKRDRRTVRFFGRIAMAEFDLTEAEAKAAMSILLTGIESVRAQWRSRPTAERRRFLEDLYVDLVLGGLSAIGSREA